MRKSVLVFDSAVVTLFVISALTVTLAQPAYPDDVTPPPVPSDIQVPAGNVAFLVGHAVGTQNYICLPSNRGFAWALFTPEATLFDDQKRQLITHFFSPNPSEGGTIRATWQHSKDTSIVWAQVIHGPFHRPRLRRAGCDSLAPAPRGQEAEVRTDRWRHAVGDHLRPAAEHLWRGRTVDGLCLRTGRRQEGVRAVHGRLLLLQGRQRGRRRLAASGSSELR